MKLDLRQPNLTGSDHEMLLGLKSYLFQLREQLQWAFDNLEAGSGGSGGAGGTGTVINVNQTGTTPSGPSFTEIKNYIIKQTDIAYEYINFQIVQEELKKIYVAQSEYGDFVKEVSNRITQTENGITQEFTNIQAVITDVSNSIGSTVDDAKNDLEEQLQDLGEEQNRETQILRNELSSVGQNLEAFSRIITSEETEEQHKVISIGVQGIIRSGYLGEENGVAIYGVEVGQSVGVPGETPIYRANAQFRPDKLAFYNSNGDMESYIGQQKLSIINGEVDKTFKRGDLVDEVKTSGIHAGDVVTKWEE